LGIFITRASGSVVLRRGCLSRIACPRLPLPACRLAGLPGCPLLLLLQLRQLRDRLLQAFLLLLGRSTFCRRLFRG
jgi:hypothetical protein